MRSVEEITMADVHELTTDELAQVAGGKIVDQEWWNGLSEWAKALLGPFI